MESISSGDRRFLETIELWLQVRPEILVLIRYSRAGGSKSFEFFSSIETLAERTCQLPPQTSLIAFRQPQLPLRGVVDENFISNCVRNIKDGSEFLVVETVQLSSSGMSWLYHTAGESHNQLRKDLEALRGRSVAAGEYPPWLQEGADTISAVVPDERGVVSSGVY